MFNVISLDIDSKLVIDSSGVSSDPVGVFFNEGAK